MAAPPAPAHSSGDGWCLLKADGNKALLRVWGSISSLGVNEESSSVFPDLYFFGSCNESALMEKSGGIKQEIKSIWFHGNIIGFCRDCS